MKPTPPDLAALAEANALSDAMADSLLALGHKCDGDKLPRGAAGYEIGGTIGAGAMGAVVAARHSGIRRDVAMKLLPQQCDEAARLRFVAEAQITGQLEHPNIVPVHELAVDESGRAYYTMKLVHGATWAAILERLARGEADAIARYPLAALLTIFQKVCDAVAFAHSRGVIHRDLKPANVMVGDYGEVVVMDWGVAKVLDLAAVNAVEAPVSTVRSEAIGVGETCTGTIVGTPHYMAPEQARGESDAVDERADIYSLGAILFHILSLRPPVQGATAGEVIAKVADGQIEQIAAAEKHPHLPEQRVPDSLAAVVRRAMSLRPADRYANVQTLQREISAYQHGFATEAEQAGLWKQCVLFVRRHKTSSIVAAVGLGLVTAVSAGFMVNVVHERDRAEQAIENLRRMAPSFLEQSRVLASQQHFEGALAKVDTALLFLPDRADFHAQRGNMLQVLRRFDEAAACYLRTLSLDPAFPNAAENAALSGKLAALLKKEGALPQAALFELEASWRRQSRSGEILSLASELRLPIEQKLPLWRDQLRGWLGSEPALTLGNDGSIKLNLNGQSISDLKPLRGLPLTILWMDFTQVRDLSPLAGMPLKELRLSGTPVADLSPLQGLQLKWVRISRCKAVHDLTPLAGMPLEGLSIAGSSVADLSPLKGAPLRYLQIASTRVTDISPLKGMALEILTCGGNESPITDISVLRGMPLRIARFPDAAALTDLRPLEDCPTLKEVLLPPNPGDLGFLRKLPNLKFINRQNGSGDERTQPAEVFWAEYDRTHPRSQK